MTPPVVLPPRLEWRPSDGFRSRGGRPVERVVVHRWGSRFPADEAATYRGVVGYLAAGKLHEASAHIVFPGSAVPGHATQLVKWGDAAWAQADYNATSDCIESADALWVPAGGKYDDAGFAVLARIVAFRLHVHGLPAKWSERGVCRHADLGLSGGGHTACPTTDVARWRKFVERVRYELERGDFLAAWGR